jgi:hypothetical protein
MADQEKYNVVARENIEVRIDADQLGRADDGRSGLLKHFSRESVFDFFAVLDATAGKMPAGAIAMANEKNARIFIDDDALSTERDDIGTIEEK